jgi:uracil-DNA glycosylase family 4
MPKYMLLPNDMETSNVNPRNPTTQSGQTADSILRQALLSKGLRYVGVKGNTSGGIAIYGEAPGKDEDLYGQPFIGYSGKLLDEMIRESGLPYYKIYFSNAYKTRPPDNDIKRISELGIPIDYFIKQFIEELILYKPAFILACGKTVTNLLCPETKPRFKRGKNQEDKEGFMSWRGSLLISPLLQWPHYVIPMAHPAFVLRNYAEREICVLILQKALEEYSHFTENGTINTLPMRDLIVNPSYEDAVSFLVSCVNSPNPISIDIELLSRKVPYTISFATSPTRAVSMSLWNYPLTSLCVLWRLMNKILSTKRIIGQNFTSFDAHWLRCLGFNVNISNVDDTLLRHHVLWPSLRHRLEFLGLQYTRQPFWKEEGKGWSPKSGLEKLMRYNALDAACTYEIYLAQEKEFNERK